MDALQSHFRLSDERVGLVLSSNAAIAEVRSSILDVLVDFCVLAELESCHVFLAFFDLTFGRSEMREPAANGGSLDDLEGTRWGELEVEGE